MDSPLRRNNGLTHRKRQYPATPPGAIDTTRPQLLPCNRNPTPDRRPSHPQRREALQ